MSLMQPGALQLPSNQQLRNVVLSYLLYHGHKDTARVFAAEIARREESESIERCPLWQTQDSVAEAEGQMDTSDTVATHAPSSARETDSQPTNAIISPPTNSNDTHRRERRTLENILADVEARRRIRHTILSGRIEGAIELIAQHSPDFLPVNPPTNLARSPKAKLQPGSHAPSVPTPSPPSSTSPVLAPSRSPTPVSSQSQTTTAPEKASQKADVPTSSSLEAGSPELVDSNEGQTQTHSSRNPNSPSLARSVDPVHILFNLQVQQFVEAVRTVPLLPSKEHGEGSLRQDANPTKPEGTDADAEMHSPDWDLVGHDSEDTSIRHNGATPIAQNDLPPEARQKRLFELASGLYQNVAALGCEADRKVYAKEVEQVCSLMLGPSPENSLAAPYLSMSRREALADQVNSAMLWHVGEPPAPRLQIWAQTTKVAWDQVKAMRPTLHKGTEVPADVRMYTKYVLRNAEGDEQGQSQTVIPFDFQALALA